MTANQILLLYHFFLVEISCLQMCWKSKFCCNFLARNIRDMYNIEVCASRDSLLLKSGFFFCRVVFGTKGQEAWRRDLWIRIKCQAQQNRMDRHGKVGYHIFGNQNSAICRHKATGAVRAVKTMSKVQWVRDRWRQNSLLEFEAG